MACTYVYTVVEPGLLVNLCFARLQRCLTRQHEIGNFSKEKFQRHERTSANYVIDPYGKQLLSCQKLRN